MEKEKSKIAWSFSLKIGNAWICKDFHLILNLISKQEIT